MKIPFWIIFLGFVALVAILSSLGLVYVADHNLHGMVRSDYYEAGLHLDQQRQSESTFDSLHVSMRLVQKQDSLILETAVIGNHARPEPSPLSPDQVTLFLQRPDDPSADRELVMHLAQDSASITLPRWSIATPTLRKGRWNCRVVFETPDDGKKLENSFAFNAN